MAGSKFRSLIKLVLVVAIVVLVSSVIVKGVVYFVQTTGQAQTKRGLAQVRSVVARGYARNVDDGKLSYPSSIVASDFEKDAVPMNWLNFNRSINYVLKDVEGYSPKSKSCGWWYNTKNGRVGAYSNGRTNVSDW